MSFNQIILDICNKDLKQVIMIGDIVRSRPIVEIKDGKLKPQLMSDFYKFQKKKGGFLLVHRFGFLRQ